MRPDTPPKDMTLLVETHKLYRHTSRFNFVSPFRDGLEQPLIENGKVRTLN